MKVIEIFETEKPDFSELEITDQVAYLRNIMLAFNHRAQVYRRKRNIASDQTPINTGLVDALQGKVNEWERKYKKAKSKYEALKTQIEIDKTLSATSGQSVPDDIVLNNAKNQPAIILANPVSYLKSQGGQTFVGDPRKFDWNKVRGRARNYYSDVNHALERNGYKFTKMYAVFAGDSPTVEGRDVKFGCKKGDFFYAIIDDTNTICLYYFPLSTKRSWVGKATVFKGKTEYSIGRFLNDSEISQNRFLTTGVKHRM